MDEQPAGTSAEKTAAPGSLQPVGAACFIDGIDEHWKGPECRRQPRLPVQGTRPIAIRRLDAAGAMQGEWMLADILNISLGGLGLVVSGPLPLACGEPLLLDLRAHPGFGVVRLQVEVRWSTSSANFTTFGIAFLSELTAIPPLELERRQVRRLPQDHAWMKDG